MITTTLGPSAPPHRDAHEKAARHLWRVVVVASLLGSAPAAAETTGQLRGTVSTTDGTPLPRVVVAVSSPAQIGGELIAQSDDEGRFRYPVLAPGEYVVRVALDGFAPRELTGVRLRVDRTTEIEIALEEVVFDDEIVVTESTPVVDPRQTSSGQTFTDDYLGKAAIGMDSRTYTGVLGQAAGVNGGGLTYSVHGSMFRENAFLIDGVDTTSPFEGVFTFDSIGFDGIEEVVVHTAGFEAEYGFATGGVINVVTKSGGNDFSGSVDARYRDESFEEAGDHYDPDEEPTDQGVLDASLGGPILRDRLWFFLSGGGIRGSQTPVDTPYSNDLDARVGSAKLTWQASPSWSVVGKYLEEDLLSERVDAGRFVSEEATSRLDYEPAISSLAVTGILTPRVVWSARLADLATPLTRVPQDGDLKTIRHVNDATGEVSGNYPGQFYVIESRAEAQTQVDWFTPTRWGAHEVEAGLRFSKLEQEADICLNGSGRPCVADDEGFLFFDGVDPTGASRPDAMLVERAPGTRTIHSEQQSVYVQDAWRVRPDLTLKLGLRWDGVQQENDVGRRVVDYDLLQPRLGLAWDVGTARPTVVRAFWGRFTNPTLLQVANFLGERSIPSEIWLSCSEYVAADPSICSSVAGGSGLGYRTDPEGWDPAGWFLLPGLVFSSEPNQVVEGFRPTYADQLLVGVERELFRRTSVELSYLRKEYGDLQEDVCVGNYPEPSEAADCSSYLALNVPQASREYEAWTLRFESRALDRFHAIASWVYSESTGSEPGGYFSTDWDVYPFHYTNRYGYLPDHSRHRVRINGFVELPWNVELGSSAYWASEIRWTPQDFASPPYGSLFTEPRGSRKEDGLYSVDLQLSKGFDLGPARLLLIGSVLNLLDAERPVGFCERITGCGGDIELGDPIDWQRPRRYEIGVRLVF